MSKYSHVVHRRILAGVAARMPYGAKHPQPIDPASVRTPASSGVIEADWRQFQFKTEEDRDQFLKDYPLAIKTA